VYKCRFVSLYAQLETTGARSTDPLGYLLDFYPEMSLCTISCCTNTMLNYSQPRLTMVPLVL